MSASVSKLKHSEWLQNTSQFSDYNYTHYWAYGELAAKRIGAGSEHIAVKKQEGGIIALANVRIKRLPFKLGGIAFISGGPMVSKRNQTTGDNLIPSLEALKNEYVLSQGLILRITQRHREPSACSAEEEAYRKEGFEIVGRTNATLLLDLKKGLKNLRKEFHQKWRNVLNKSEKQGIIVRTGGDLKFFQDFSALFRELVAKKSFQVDMDDDFYSKVQKQSPDQEQFQMSIAYNNDKPIAGHLSSMTGDTCVYILGAANNIGRKLGAAYLLQWHVIQEAIKKGCSWYDLGGIDKEENPHVYLFKRRMGGIEVGPSNIFEFRCGIKGQLTLLAEKTYQAAKKMSASNIDK